MPVATLTTDLPITLYSAAGVGQSLYSSHLDAVYGSSHVFIDPNIWYDEQGMRKQVEQSAGKFELLSSKPSKQEELLADLVHQHFPGESSESCCQALTTWIYGELGLLPFVPTS